MLLRLFPLILACLLAVLPYVHAEAAPLQQEQTTTIYHGEVNAVSNIRSGPGLQYPVVDQAQPGEVVTVVGCNEDCSWFQLDNGNWIAAFLVDLSGTSQEPSASTNDSTTSDSTTSDDGDGNQ